MNKDANLKINRLEKIIISTDTYEIAHTSSTVTLNTDHFSVLVYNFENV